MSDVNQLLVRKLGLVDYAETWQAMQHFTDTRDEHAQDELWLLEHHSVFTQGQAGKAEHLLMPGDIPVVQVDRGGQVTYHGPGQLVAYPLINLRRRKFGVRDLVTAIENTIVASVAPYGIEAYAKPDAPGVYVDGCDLLGLERRGDKIASLGLRVRRGCSFHGLALNVDMDLAPFQRINPCGYQGLEMTQISQWSSPAPLVDSVAIELTKQLVKQLDYDSYEIIDAN